MFLFVLFFFLLVVLFFFYIHIKFSLGESWVIIYHRFLLDVFIGFLCLFLFGLRALKPLNSLKVKFIQCELVGAVGEFGMFSKQNEI